MFAIRDLPNKSNLNNAKNGAEKQKPNWCQSA